MVNGNNLNDLNTMNSLECGHHLCESLYGQTAKSNLIGNQINLNSNLTSTKSNEQETPSHNSCAFNTNSLNSTFSLPQSMINDCSPNFRSMLDLSAPLIYLDYNKGNLLFSFFSFSFSF